MGYKAVAVEDEHGTSYIILPGNKVYEESTYEKLNPDYNYRVYHQKAYHGSPYTFDHFDLGAIGTGEGNQHTDGDYILHRTRKLQRIIKIYWGRTAEKLLQEKQNIK